MTKLSHELSVLSSACSLLLTKILCVPFEGKGTCWQSAVGRSKWKSSQSTICLLSRQDCPPSLGPVQNCTGERLCKSRVDRCPVIWLPSLLFLLKFPPTSSSKQARRMRNTQSQNCIASGHFSQPRSQLWKMLRECSTCLNMAFTSKALSLNLKIQQAQHWSQLYYPELESTRTEDACIIYQS